MSQGIPVIEQYTTSDISDAICKHRGILTYTAHHLGLNRDTLYDYLTRHPHLWDLVHEQRKVGAQKAKAWACDIAFQTMQKLAAKSDEYPHVACKAAAYILDNMDEYLDCKKKINSQDNQAEVEIKYEDVMNQLERNRKELESKNGN